MTVLGEEVLGSQTMRKLPPPRPTLSSGRQILFRSFPGDPSFISQGWLTNSSPNILPKIKRYLPNTHTKLGFVIAEGWELEERGKVFKQL